MPGPAVVPIALGVGQILGSLFGNLFGAKKQADATRQATDAQIRAANYAADREYQAITDALNYQRSIDERDYRDWLTRETRDRRDWEASEQRRQPFRALADSAVRTLADYIRVPGMQAAQEVPVPIWSDPHQQAPMGQPTSSTMPVGGNLRSYTQPVRQTPQPGMFVSPQRRTLADYAR